MPCKACTYDEVGGTLVLLRHLLSPLHLCMRSYTSRHRPFAGSFLLCRRGSASQAWRGDTLERNVCVHWPFALSLVRLCGYSPKIIPSWSARNRGKTWLDRPRTEGMMMRLGRADEEAFYAGVQRPDKGSAKRRRGTKKCRQVCPLHPISWSLNSRLQNCERYRGPSPQEWPISTADSSMNRNRPSGL